MAKFKVGDIIIGNEKKYYGITARGVKCIVTHIYPDGDIEVKPLDSEIEYDVHPEFFDLVSSDEITITRHGNKVVAKYGKKVGVAKCNPEDKFDFAIGAKLAFSRLMGEPEEKPEQDKIEVGDTVRIIGNKFLMHYIPIGSLVNVREVNEHGNLFCMRKDLFGAATGQWVNPKDVKKVSFDWSGFKAGKFFVKCTKDNFESFIAEAKKHDCRFVPDENFNPFVTGAMCTVKFFMELSGLKTVDENEVLVIFSNEKLFVDVAIPSNKDIVTW